MSRTRARSSPTDRTAFAQGYEAADNVAPYVRGAPLAPAGWVDVTFGAGSVASTASGHEPASCARSPMPLRAAAGSACRPRSGLEFTTPRGRRPTRPAMRYGNGLMHVGNGGRSYLHHTGGMVSFSSSFHLDTASGVGAFASSTLSAFAGYRPRLLTLFAVDALTAALRRTAAAAAAARSTRRSPIAARLCRPLCRARQARSRSAPASRLTHRRRRPLGARSQPWGGDLFRTTPSAISRSSRCCSSAPADEDRRRQLGPDQLRPRGLGAGRRPPPTRALARLAGRYVNDSPWFGTRDRGRARRQAVARDRDAADPHRRQSVARRRGKLVARARLLRQLRSTAARRRFIFSGEKFVAPRHLGLARAGRALGAAP